MDDRLVVVDDFLEAIVAHPPIKMFSLSKVKYLIGLFRAFMRWSLMGHATLVISNVAYPILLSPVLNCCYIGKDPSSNSFTFFVILNAQVTCLYDLQHHPVALLQCIAHLISDISYVGVIK